MSVANAVLERLRVWAASESSLVSVFDTTIPGIPPADPASGLGRYLIVSERTTVRALGIDAVSSSAGGQIYVTAAAWYVDRPDSAAPACRYLVDQVQRQLVDWTPEVAGLVCAPFRQIGNPTPSPDESLTDRHLIFAADQFEYDAIRIS